MASTAQVLSNRKNATRSTGPITDAGKSTAKLNATKHGLTGQTVVLPTEDAQAYTAFATKLTAEHAPKSTTEEMLVQTIIDTQWRLERARRLEVNLLTLAHYGELPAALAAIEDTSERDAMIEAHAAIQNERLLRNLHIQEARLQRSLYKAMEELRHQQGARKTQLVQALDSRMYHEEYDLPFDPAQFGFVFEPAEYDRELTRRKINTASNAIFNPNRVRRNKAESAIAAS